MMERLPLDGREDESQGGDAKKVKEGKGWWNWGNHAIGEQTLTMTTVSGIVEKRGKEPLKNGAEGGEKMPETKEARMSRDNVC